MACTYTFKGKIYSEAEFNQMLSDNPNLVNDYIRNPETPVAPTVETAELVKRGGREGVNEKRVRNNTNDPNTPDVQASRKRVQAAMFTTDINSDISREVVEKAYDFIRNKLGDYSNRARAFPDDVKIANVKEALENSEIVTELETLNLESLVKALEHDYTYCYNTLHGSQAIFGGEGIITRLNQYAGMDMTEISTNDKLRKEFTNFMRHTNIFLRSFSRINTLKSDKSLTRLTDIERNLNDVITWHQSLQRDITSANNLYNTLIEHFFEVRNTQISTNPLVKQGLLKIFQAQDDESIKQLWLDAMADTNNVFLATTVRNYIKEMALAEEEYNAELLKFRKVLMENFHLNDINQINSLNVSSFDKYLEKNKNGQYTGRVVQKYDYDAFWGAYAEYKKTFEHLLEGSIERTEARAKWFAENTQFTMTDEEIEAVIHHKRKTLSRKEFERWYSRNVSIIAEGDLMFKIGGEFLVPTDNYAKQEFLAVKDDPLYQYLTNDLVDFGDILGKSNMISNGFIPSTYAKDAIKKSYSPKAYFDKHKAKKANQFIGEHGDKIRLLTFPMIEKLDQEELIPIPEKLAHEKTLEDYRKRVLVDVYNKGYGKFDTWEDLKKHNAEITERNRIAHGAAFDKNLHLVVSDFIKRSIIYKHKKNIEAELTVALYKTSELEFITRNQKGNRAINSQSSNALRTVVYDTEKKTDSNVGKHFDHWLEAIFYENFDIDEGAWTAIGKILLKYVSAKNMWFNISAAANNVAFGNLQIKTEKAAKYFVDGSSLHAAEKEYWSNFTNFIADIGNEVSDNLTSAILKRMDIVESQTEKEVGAQMLYKHLMSWDSLYMLQESGEHWMQNKMLLAMMRSHRVIDGKIKSFIEYKDDLRLPILSQLLPAPQYDRLVKYIETRRKNEQRPDSKPNYIEEYLIKFVDSSILKEYNKIKKQEEIKLKEEFEKYPTLRDSVELVNGTMQVKKTDVGEVLNEGELGLFREKVKRVNHKMHGIYNRQDASVAQRYTGGKIAMQFRKWVIPGWNKRFGSKFFKSYWNENRKEWDKGAYHSLVDLIAMPFRHNIGEDGEKQAQATGKALGRIFEDTLHFMRNAKIYYNTLDDFEKANVTRSIYETTALISLLALGIVLGNLTGGDDDDRTDLPLIVDLLMYQVDRLTTEVGFYNPLGLYNETKKIMGSPAAAISAISDAMTLIGNSFGYVIYPDERTYKSGLYHGELKVSVNSAKMIPIYNQIYRMKRINRYNQYYNLFFF